MENNLEHNELYKKGGLLMQSALKKYAAGDNEGGDKDRQLSNEYYDQAKDELNRISDNITALYGENRNFGIIYSVIEENIKNYIKENKNSKAVSEFIKLIKSNKILKEQFNIYNTLCNSVTTLNAEDYLNEVLAIIPNFNKKEIFENNSKLIDFIHKNKLDEFIDIEDEKLELYEAIEYLLLNKKTLTNIEVYKKNKDVIKESLNARLEKNQISDDIVMNESSYSSELKNTLKKHLNELNEDELMLIEELYKGNKQEIFNKYKNETLNFISEQITYSSTLEDKIDWNNIQDKIKLKEYKENTYFNDIISFINIKNIINE